MGFGKRTFDFFTLFTSAATLICCALPAALVALGAGGVMVALVSNVPGLIWVSKHKLALFVVAGVLLLIGGVTQYRSSATDCPLEARQACGDGKRLSFWIYCCSVSLYAVGLFFAYVAPRLM